MNAAMPGAQTQLFDDAPAPQWEPVDSPEPERAQVWLRRAFIPADEATTLFERLREAIPWRHDDITMFGKTYAVPRLHQWYGDASYTWSGIEMQPLRFTPELDAIRQRIEAATRRRFNSALINYYRDGADTVGWHADDEPELGPAPFIASLSLGAERDFALRRNEPDPEGQRRRIDLALPHGSLLVMTEGFQAAWQHSLPRRKRVHAGRINLTFRAMHPA